MSFQLLGFEDERQLVSTFAKALNTKPVFALETRYRAGELTVRMPDIDSKEVVLVANIDEDPGSTLRVLFAAKALRHTGVKKITLLAPWIAYGRQDRVARPGEVPGGLIIADTLSRLFDKIITLDAHSPMFIKAFRKKLVNVCVAPDKQVQDLLGSIDLVVAADKGASQRAKVCAKALKLPLIILEKQRTNNGVQIQVTQKDGKQLVGKRPLIIDDISDTGGTLVTAASMLREHGALSVAALVSHVPDISLLHARVGGIVQVEALHDHMTQTVHSCAVTSLIRAL